MRGRSPEGARAHTHPRVPRACVVHLVADASRASSRRPRSRDSAPRTRRWCATGRWFSNPPRTGPRGRRRSRRPRSRRPSARTPTPSPARSRSRPAAHSASPARRARSPDPDPDVAAVLVLGARAPREGREPTHLTLDVRVSPAHPENTSPPAWTSCDLTLDHLGVWRASIARDDPADSSRAEGVPPAACTVVPLADSGDAVTSTINSGDDSSSASVLIRARVEVSPSLVSAEANASIDSRVDVVVLASTATNRDPVVKVVVDGLAIVRASDLVELAWAWVSRAARCAAELFGDVLSACGGEGGEGGGRETGGAGDGRDPTPDLGRSSPFDRARADALVRGCCAAVASYANAGCDCASRVVPTETLLVGETLAAARDASAARSLAKLCGAEEKEEEGVDRADDEESGCVAESATLAAVRAFVARDAAANAPNAAVASYANDTARDPVVVAAATRPRRNRTTRHNRTTRSSRTTRTALS